MGFVIRLFYTILEDHPGIIRMNMSEITLTITNITLNTYFSCKKIDEIVMKFSVRKNIRIFSIQFYFQMLKNVHKLLVSIYKLFTLKIFSFSYIIKLFQKSIYSF